MCDAPSTSRVALNKINRMLLWRFVHGDTTAPWVKIHEMCYIDQLSWTNYGWFSHLTWLVYPLNLGLNGGPQLITARGGPGFHSHQWTSPLGPRTHSCRLTVELGGDDTVIQIS